MLFQYSVMLRNFCLTPFPKPSSHNDTPPNSRFLISARNPRAAPSFRCLSNPSCPSVSLNDVANVLHNKVLVAATVSAAMGQLVKPFTSVLLYGKKFDVKAALQAGGFPSTHSSAVVATATSLALERGFSDPIFGLAVVYAGLVMYDAQGVRREVGIHARTMNKYIRGATSNSIPCIKHANDLSSTNSYPNVDKRIDPLFLEEDGSFQRQPTDPPVLLKSNDRKPNSTFVRSSGLVSDVQEGLETGFSPLKESIGHTELEVTAGALLGFIVSIAICPYV